MADGCIYILFYVFQAIKVFNDDLSFKIKFHQFFPIRNSNLTTLCQSILYDEPLISEKYQVEHKRRYKILTILYIVQVLYTPKRVTLNSRIYKTTTMLNLNFNKNNISSYRTDMAHSSI